MSREEEYACSTSKNALVTHIKPIHSQDKEKEKEKFILKKTLKYVQMQTQIWCFIRKSTTFTQYGHSLPCAFIDNDNLSWIVFSTSISIHLHKVWSTRSLTGKRSFQNITEQYNNTTVACHQISMVSQHFFPIGIKRSWNICNIPIYCWNQVIASQNFRLLPS